MPLLCADALRRAAPYGQASILEAIVSRADEILPKYKLAALPRVWGFLSVVVEETGGLRVVSENLDYSALRAHQVFPAIFPSIAAARRYAGDPQAFANRVYGRRMGNKKPDDGWRYRGQGLIQITGHDNFALLQRLTGLPLLDHPEMATAPEHMLDCAAALFARFPHILSFCDAENWRAVWALIGSGRSTGPVINLSNHQAALRAVKAAIPTLGKAS